MPMLGSVDLGAGGSPTLLFTAASTMAFNLRFCNRNITGCRIRAAIGVGGSPVAKDYIDYDLDVVANGILEDSLLVCSSGENVWVYSDTANVSVRAWSGIGAVNGILGSADLVAATPVLLYTNSSAIDMTCNIRFANRGVGDCGVSVAIGTGVSAVAKDYITYEATLRLRGILEDFGVVVGAGEKLWVTSNVSDVSVRAHAL